MNNYEWIICKHPDETLCLLIKSQLTAVLLSQKMIKCIVKHELVEVTASSSLCFYLLCSCLHLLLSLQKLPWQTSILSHYFKVTQVQKKQQQRLIIFLRGLYVLRPDLFELLSEMNFNFTCLHTLVWVLTFQILFCLDWSSFLVLIPLCN